MHVLITPRLTMRPPASPDADDIALWLSDPAVARMLGPVPHPYASTDAMEWIDRDELVEVTPLNVRVRKAVLSASFRPARRENAE